MIAVYLVEVRIYHEKSLVCITINRKYNVTIKIQSKPSIIDISLFLYFKIYLLIVMPDIKSINIGCLIKRNHSTIVIKGFSESDRTSSFSILKTYSWMDYLSRTYRFCPVGEYCNGNTKNLLRRLKTWYLVKCIRCISHLAIKFLLYIFICVLNRVFCCCHIMLTSCLTRTTYFSRSRK